MVSFFGKSGTEHWQVFMMIKYESRERNDQKDKMFPEK
jgi:hypothetical protein